MTDFARLGMEVDSSDVEKATESLDRLTRSSERAESQLSSQEKEWISQGKSLEEMAKKADAFAKGQDSTAGATKRTQTESEKYVASLQKQVETFGMSRAQLAAYKASQLEFTDQQAEVVAANLLALQSFEKTGGGLDELGIKSQRAREQIGLMVRDILRGDFSQVGERLGKFIGQSDVAIGTLLRVIGPVAALIGSVVAVAKAFNDGEKEVNEFNNAILISGNYAGQTADSMRKLAQEVSAAGLMTVGQTKDIVRELVASGQISSKAIGDVVALAENFARATGKDASKIGADLIKIFSDPAKGAEELNRQINLLDKAQLQHLKTLMDFGKEGEAQVFLAEKLKERLAGVEQNVGSLERGWAKIKQTASSAWDAMLSIGRPKTLEDQLKDAQDALDAAQRRFNFRPNQNLPGLLQAGAEVDRLIAAVQAEKDRAQAAAETAENLRKENAERETIKQLQEEQYNRTLRLAEVQNKMQASEIESQFKIGAISEEERNKRTLANDLQLATIRLGINEQKRGAEDITRVDLARLQTEAAIIDANRRARVTEFDQAQKLLEITRLKAQAEADARSRGETAGRQLDEIGDLQKGNEALRQRQKELGLTREQVDALRQVQLQMQIDQLEIEEARTLEEGSLEDDPFIQRLREQIRLLKERKDLEFATDTTSRREAQFQADLEALKAAREAELITESEYNDEVLELKTRHESAVTGITNRGYLDRFRFSQMTLTQQAEFVAGTLQGMLAGAAQHNKLAFEAHKAASIANTIISTYTGATKALEWGWPLGPIFAAAITLAGLTNLAYISSTSFQGSGSVGGGAGTAIGTTAPIGNISGGIPQTTTAEPAREPRTVIFRIVPDPTAGPGPYPMSINNLRELAEAIADESDGGVKIG